MALLIYAQTFATSMVNWQNQLKKTRMRKSIDEWILPFRDLGMPADDIRPTSDGEELIGDGNCFICDAENRWKCRILIATIRLIIGLLWLYKKTKLNPTAG